MIFPFSFFLCANMSVVSINYFVCKIDGRYMGVHRQNTICFTCIWLQWFRIIIIGICSYIASRAIYLIIKSFFLLHVCCFWWWCFLRTMCLQSILIINCFPCTYRYVWMCRTIDGLTMILNEFSSFTTFLPGVCCILYKQFFYRFFRVPRISFVNGVFFIIIFDCMHSVLDALKSSVLNKAKKKER